MESIVQDNKNVLFNETIESIQTQANSEQEEINSVNKHNLPKKLLNQVESQFQTENLIEVVETPTSKNIDSQEVNITSNKKIEEMSSESKKEDHEIEESTQNIKKEVDESKKQENPAKFKRIMTQVKAIMGIHYMKNDGVSAEVLPGFYLGSIGAAFNKKHLESEKINHILCCCDGVKEAYPTLFKYKFLCLLDKPTEDITRYFEETTEYIHDILTRGEKILVHCFAGKSRSTTIMISYLIKYHRMSVDQALDLIRAKRPVIRPNIGFIKQLRDYEKKVLGQRTQETEKN